MIFVTTFTKEIYHICGKRLLESFINTNNHKKHQLYVFFENEDDLHTEYYPEWLVEWSDKPYFTFVNLMNYEYDSKRIIPFVDELLRPKIKHTDEYSSPRSVKWFRPVAAIHYFYELMGNTNFSSIDADCLFTQEVSDNFFDTLFSSIF